MGKISIEYIVVAFLIMLFLFFGLWNISKQTLVDEPLWAFDRIEQYWHNIKEGDFKNSRPSDKPGVTVALLGGYGLTAHVRPSEIKETITPVLREELLAKIRIPLVLFLAILLPLFYSLTKRLFGRDIAIVTLALTTLSPILIGMSRVFNPDTLLWLLLPTTILSYIVLTKTPSKKLIILTGILLGLSLLTKYVANILFVFFPLVTIFYAYYTCENQSETQKVLRKGIISLCGVTTIAIILYCLLLPSVWFNPKHIILGTIWSEAFAPIWKAYVLIAAIITIDLFVIRNSLLAKSICALRKLQGVILPIVSAVWIGLIFFVLTSAHFGMQDYQTALQSPKSAGRDLGFLTTFLSDFYVLFFGLSLIALIGFFIFLARQLKKSPQSQSLDWIALSLLAFPVLYYAGSAVSGVVTILRYQVALFPLIYILASIGIVGILGTQKKITKYIFLVALIFISCAGLLHIQPYYFSYANALLPEEQVLNIKDMGDGSYQAAHYLNNLPNAEDLTIWADKNGICASFIGRCETTLTVAKFAERDIIHFDYYVITRGRKHLSIRNATRMRRKEGAPPETFHFDWLYRDGVQTVSEILPGNRKSNYIRIISAEDVNIIAPNDQI